MTLSLEIQVLDDIMQRIPKEWNQINRQTLIEKFWSEKLDDELSSGYDLVEYEETEDS